MLVPLAAAAHADEGEGELAASEAFFWRAGLSTAVVNTDFRGSWIKLESTERRDTYLLTIRITNTGALVSKNGFADLVLANGWSYRSSDGDFEMMTTQERAYGQAARWTLLPMAANQNSMIRVRLRSEEAERTPLLIAVTSEYSAPLYAELSAEDISAARQADLIYWLRYAWLMARLSLQGLWDRFVTGLTLIAYRLDLSTVESRGV